MQDDWSDIGASTDPSSANFRRADPSHPLDFWRGRDFRGRYLFRLTERSGLPLNGKSPALSGIEIDLASSKAEERMLTLVLLDTGDVELFRALCTDLLIATRLLASDSGRGIACVLERLHRWQEMLASRRNSLLSRSEIIGLIGELFFLREEMLGRMTPVAAVSAWVGPYQEEQDFVVGGTIFEVKTMMATSDRRFHISSEDQLDTTSGPIILCHQTLSVATAEVGGAFSLNRMVSTICSHLAGIHVGSLDLFNRALLKAGYEKKPEYDEVVWMMVERSFYQITEAFPRIVKADLSVGVSEVRYRLDVQACQPFRVDVDEFMRGLVNGKD
jgi:hypothetical protein